MMDHNQEHYQHFLKCIYCSRLHWFCCCCRLIVTQQLKAFDQDQSSRFVKIENDDDTERTISRVFDTRDISIQDQGINTTGMELSIETRSMSLE